MLVSGRRICVHIVIFNCNILRIEGRLATAFVKPLSSNVYMYLEARTAFFSRQIVLQTYSVVNATRRYCVMTNTS